MAEQWYYRMFGQDFGPIPLSELQDLVRAGSVSSTDEVRAENSSKWVSAGTVRELGTASAAPSTTASATAVAEVEHHPPQGSDDWYCKFNGHDVGPIRFQVLLAFAEQGRLFSDDELKLGTGGKWRRAGSIGRLVSALPNQGVAPGVPGPATPPVEAPKPVVANAAMPAPAAVPSASGAPGVAPAAVSQPQRPTVSPPRPAYRPGSSSDWSFSSILKGPLGITGIAIVFVALLVAGWKYWPKGNVVDVQRYNSLKLLLDDIRANREAKSTDFQSIKKRGNKLHQEYLPTLRIEAVQNPGKQKLLEVVRDHLPRLIGSDLTKENWYEQNYEANLKEAAALLDIK